MRHEGERIPTLSRITAHNLSDYCFYIAIELVKPFEVLNRPSSVYILKTLECRSIKRRYTTILDEARPHPRINYGATAQYPYRREAEIPRDADFKCS